MAEEKTAEKKTRQQKWQLTIDQSLGNVFASTSDVDLQYRALQAMCESYNKRVTLSSMRFYPKGGSVYRIFWEQEQKKQYGYVKDTLPACYQTGDVDGMLIVVPRGMTDNKLLDFIRSEKVSKRREPAKFSHIDFQRDVLDVAEEAYAKVFNKKDAALWLNDAASSQIYQLTLPPTSFYVQEEEDDDERTFVFEEFPTFKTENFTKGWYCFIKKQLGLKMTIKGKTEGLDVHFAFLRPVAREESRSNMLQIMWRATKLTDSIFLMQKQHHFIDQFRTLLERFLNYYVLAVLDKKENNSAQLKRILHRVDSMIDVNKFQGVLKTEKTLCRVETMSPSFQHELMQNMYDWRRNSAFKGKIGLQSSKLKKNVNALNAVILRGLRANDLDYRHNKLPRPVGFKEKDMNTLLPSKRERDLLTKNSKNLICNDMTVGQTITLLRHLFDSTKHIGTAAIQEARQKELFAQCFHNTLQYKQLLCADMRF